jgi:hypothetical protein
VGAELEPGGSHAWGRTRSGWKPFRRSICLAQRAAGLSPARSPRCGKKARPGRPLPEGPERMRRTAEDGEFASRGIRLWPKGNFVDHEPLLAERVGLKAAHNRGE